MVRGLVRADVRFSVIGGVAAILHGSVRNTDDLDVCYDPANDNIEHLVSVLRSWDAYLRGVEPGLPWVLDVRALKVSPVLTLRGTEGWIDIMDRVQGVGDWDAVYAASVDATWDTLRFRILSLDALIAAKRATGRVKDRDPLLELEVLRELRRGAP
jgi:hypothetical protein